MKYSEKLKDPRWQKNRLLILERDDFTCQRCESKEKTLHVHHKYYVSGKEPWDYPDAALVTLCFECHEEEREYESVRTLFLQMWCHAGLLNYDMDSLTQGVIKLPKKFLVSMVLYLKDDSFCRDLEELIKVHNRKPPIDDLPFD